MNRIASLKSHWFEWKDLWLCQECCVLWDGEGYILGSQSNAFPLKSIRFQGAYIGPCPLIFFYRLSGLSTKNRAAINWSHQIPGGKKIDWSWSITYNLCFALNLLLVVLWISDNLCGFVCEDLLTNLMHCPVFAVIIATSVFQFRQFNWNVRGWNYVGTKPVDLIYPFLHFMEIIIWKQVFLRAGHYFLSLT